MMWPPRRASARSASSRFTRVPESTSPSEERRSVSCITSAPKRSPQMPVAVRQTPLTAMLSPSPSWRASDDSTVSAAPSAVRSTATTVPRSSTSPVNISSPLAQAGRDQHVVADAGAVERQGAQRLGDPLDALALQRVAGGAAAEQDRREEEPDLVDLAGVQERARQARTAFEQHRCDALVPELVERRAHARGLVLAGGDDHLDAGALQRVGRRARRGAGGHDRHRDAVGLLDEPGLERQARGRVEHHAARLAVDARDPGGELRVVGQRGADADREGVDRRPPAVADLAAALGGDPLRVAGRVATLPSSVIADLKSTHGRPVRPCLRKAWLSSRARPASSPVATSTSTPSSRRIPRPRPEAFSVGSSEATTTRPMPAARIASVQGGVWPWWQHGSSET